MKIKRKKEKKLQVSNVTVPDLVLLLELKKNTKKLYCKFSCPALITVQTGFVWVLEYPGISL